MLAFAMRDRFDKVVLLLLNCHSVKGRSQRAVEAAQTTIQTGTGPAGKLTSAIFLPLGSCGGLHDMLTFEIFH